MCGRFLRATVSSSENSSSGAPSSDPERGRAYDGAVIPDCVQAPCGPVHVPTGVRPVARPDQRWTGQLEPGTFEEARECPWRTTDELPRRSRSRWPLPDSGAWDISLIHISEPTRLLSSSYAVFCL